MSAVSQDEAGIAADVQSQILVGASNLAATEVHSGASPEIQQQIYGFIDRSFISGFRFVMILSTGLALLSVLVSWRMIGEQEFKTRSTMLSENPPRRS